MLAGDHPDMNIVLSNGRLEAAILNPGASVVRLALADRPDAPNPLWDPERIAAGRSHPFGHTPGYGHFVCVDGFGPASPEEQRAGLPMHGEAHRARYQVSDQTDTSVTLTADLPLVQETFTRSYRLVPGQNVLCVTSELESHLGFDRPVCWAEHATIGAPYLERGVTVADMPAVRAKTRDWSGDADPPYRLASFRDFTWPHAPTLDGSLVDLRAAGAEPSGDHSTCLMDPAREHAWITFLHPERRLLLGYIFRRDEFPWVQNWEYYPADGQLARGLEFSTMPFDVPRREAIDTARLFDTPAWRWLPAHAKITASFRLFWTATPEGFTKIEDVRLTNETITIHDQSGATLQL